MTATGPDEAVTNGRAVTRYDQGMCQKYVRGPCWEVPSLYGSAIEAWNGAKHKHPGDRNPPKGAPTYYRGGQYGHAVLSVGGGRIRSTDCTTSTYVNDAALSWPETAWGYTYLGWTEDINGVMCPGLTEPEPEPEGDDVPDYVRATMDGRNLTGEWVPIVWDTIHGDSRGGTAHEGEASLRIGSHRYVATLAATVDLPEDADRCATRTTEGSVASGGWETVETNRTCEHPNTEGNTAIVDTRTGTVTGGEDAADLRRLRWEITGPAGAKLVSAEVQLVYW